MIIIFDHNDYHYRAWMNDNNCRQSSAASSPKSRIKTCETISGGQFWPDILKKSAPKRNVKIYFSTKVFENIFWIISIEIRLSPQFWNLVVFDNIIRTRSVFPQCCKSVCLFFWCLPVLVNYQPEHTNICRTCFVSPQRFCFHLFDWLWMLLHICLFHLCSQLISKQSTFNTFPFIIYCNAFI